MTSAGASAEVSGVCRTSDISDTAAMLPADVSEVSEDPVSSVGTSELFSVVTKLPEVSCSGAEEEIVVFPALSAEPTGESLLCEQPETAIISAAAADKNLNDLFIPAPFRKVTLLLSSKFLIYVKTVLKRKSTVNEPLCPDRAHSSLFIINIIRQRCRIVNNKPRCPRHYLQLSAKVKCIKSA